MDDISLCIEKAVKRGFHKAAILLAISRGWSAIAPILAACHESRLTAREKAEIVSAFAEDGSIRIAFELCYRWRVSRRVPKHIHDLINPPKERRNETRTESSRQDPHPQHAQPLRRVG